MQNRSIALGGLENAYMRKFALYLSKRMGEQAQIGIIDHMDTVSQWDQETIWIGSEAFIEQIRKRKEDPCCIVLSEEETPEDGVICRYQPCEKIYQRIVFFCRENTGRVSSGGKQKWIVITSDSTISHLLAFSVTLACLLAEKGGVLHINLSECSGMEELFLMGEGTDLSDFILELRSDRILSLGAFARKLEKIDCILPPANPMILHEIRRSDVEMLLKTIQSETEYKYVVVMLGSACCGCDLLLRQSSAVFHLTREGESFRESQQAWLGFIHKCVEDTGISVTPVRLPMVRAESGGIHLIYEWMEGPMGQLAGKYLEGQGEEK